MQIDENGGEVKAAEGAAPADPAGDGKATCPPVSIAMAGALNGPDAALGINIKNGVQLAIDKHNAANPGCQVQLKPFDTEGDPQKATAIAPQIVDDQYTIGLVGPAFSGETKATGTVFDQAGLVATTASATNPTLSENGWKTFFRGLANDAVQGPSVANYLKNTLGYKKVCVVDDSTDYGLGLAHGGARHAGPGGRFVVQHLGEEGRQGLLRRGDPDQGRQPGRRVLRRLLRRGGAAGAAAQGRWLRGHLRQRRRHQGSRSSSSRPVKRPRTRSCPARAARPPGAFADEYKKKFNAEAGTYSAEGYDLGTILVKGIDSGAITRPALLDFVKNYNGQGVARKYQWTPTGELTTNLIWIFKVQ